MLASRWRPPTSTRAAVAAAAPVQTRERRVPHPHRRAEHPREAPRWVGEVTHGLPVVEEGVPQPWPDAVPAMYRRDAIGEALADAADGFASIIAIDCDEYPCLVSFVLTTGDQFCCAQLTRGLPGSLQGAVKSTLAFQDETGAMHGVLSFGDPDLWSDDAATRTTWRQHQLHDQAQQGPTDSAVP
jgi:hypothetical protein